MLRHGYFATWTTYRPLDGTDKTDIDNLAKAVELKPRQGTGLFGMAKRRTEKWQKTIGCIVGWLSTSTAPWWWRQQPASVQKSEQKLANVNNNGRKTIGFNKGLVNATRVMKMRHVTFWK